MKPARIVDSVGVWEACCEPSCVSHAYPGVKCSACGEPVCFVHAHVENLAECKRDFKAKAVRLCPPCKKGKKA